MAPLSAIDRWRDRPAFEFDPRRDDPEALLLPLSPPSPDVELRHLATTLCIELRAYDLVDTLHAEYELSRAADGEGDYFLARALLRLGDPIGLARVLAVAQSAHPEWAEEAGEALRASFGREVVPREGEDGGGEAREAAGREFGVWFEGNKGHLLFNPVTETYEDAGPDG